MAATPPAKENGTLESSARDSRLPIRAPINPALDLMRPTHRFIQSYCHQGRIGVLVELGLETWIVTERAEFIALSRDLAMHIAAANPDSVEVLHQQPYVREPSDTVLAAIQAACVTLGEQVIVTRFVRWNTDVLPPMSSPTPPRNPAIAVRLRRA